MVARIIRFLWLAVLVAMLAAAALSIRLFGPTIGPWAAGLAGVFAVLALHPLVVALNFALSRRHGDPVPADLKVSTFGAVKMYDAEIDASMRGFWFATPFRHARPAPGASGTWAVRPHALLFVHGYFCNRAIWTSFMRDAAARGYVCDAVTLEGAFSPIESYAPTVDAAIDGLLAKARDAGRPAVRVVVIAHSMGGLVMRSALTTIDASRVAHVVTLGTPHHGTVSARYAHYPNVRQMRIGSPWLADLAARESGASRDGWTSLYSAHDDIVYPQSTALLEGSRQIRLGGVGHVALCFDARVRATVFARLDELEGAQAAAT